MGALALAVGVATLVVALFLLTRRPPAPDLAPLLARLDAMERGQERHDRAIREQLAENRSGSSDDARRVREELTSSVQASGTALVAQLTAMSGVQNEQLAAFSAQIATLSQQNERRLEAIRTTVDERLTALRDDNAQKLEQMRVTVDTQLQSTLEKRLGESFRIVSDQLEQVHRGLGEMQTLATGVGDLKKVLTNVKTRGTWGEVQLGGILEQVLSPQQYAANVNTRGEGSEVVEYAIRLPGVGDDPSAPVWLPIDSKFPIEDYHRLQEAHDAGDLALIEASGKQLEAQVRKCAKDICTKYVAPPLTTDFGIMFLPTEGLYAEVIRRTALTEAIQRECKVIVAGPTTLVAILNSFRMGFRTLAIQKRSSEVWTVLGGVKTEFQKFGEVLKKVEKKLGEATNVLGEASKGTRKIEKQLRDVEASPLGDGYQEVPGVVTGEVPGLPGNGVTGELGVASSE